MKEGFDPPKNEQSYRKIKIDSGTMRLFKQLIDTMPDNIHKLVFFSLSSKYKVISNNNVNSLLQKTLEYLNIQPISIHGLRHKNASVLLYQKVSIYYVSERLGYSNIETTLSYYAQVIKELRARDEKSTIKTFEDMTG
ncbi:MULTISPECIES: tyrosine-type recombinase/integrase [Bacillus]|uniref:tyrosine-type recombinase/integrase n=1 Tax=Bacillus TaxID=1386 RepID=UPI00030FB5A0|nr:MULTISPECIES: tyrosine-type recombinase/integrase [Bacillus]